MDDEEFQDEEPQQEKTQPAISALRYETPSELYAAMQQIRNLMQHRPNEDESAVAFLARLRSSTTPEEAVTFTAFAARAKMAIWWGYECVRTSSEEMSADDRALMEQIANWTTHPDAQAREHDPDLLFRRVMLARLALDPFDQLVSRVLRCSGFLVHLRSLVAAMNQKSSVTKTSNLSHRC